MSRASAAVAELDESILLSSPYLVWTHTRQSQGEPVTFCCVSMFRPRAACWRPCQCRVRLRLWLTRYICVYTYTYICIYVCIYIGLTLMVSSPFHPTERGPPTGDRANVARACGLTLTFPRVHFSHPTRPQYRAQVVIVVSSRCHTYISVIYVYS